MFTQPRPAKPGPLLPTLLERIPFEVLSQFRMEAGAGDGGQGGEGGQGGNEPPRTFTQAQLDQVIADRLTRERAKFQDYDDLKSKATELETLKAAGQSEQEKAVNQARKEAEQTARSDERSKADTRIVKAEVRALAGTKFANPSDAVAILLAEGQLADLKVNDDGEVDEKVITARLDKLLEARPYLKASAGNGTPPPGSGLGGLGQGNRPPASKQTGAERGKAEAERRFGKSKQQQST